MRRSVLVLLAACGVAEEPSVPAPTYVYPPAAVPWQLGQLRGRFGRSQAPQRTPSLGVTGSTNVPLTRPTVWSIPGDRPARAAVFGYEGARPSVELVDVDAGTLLWRLPTTCVEPIIGVTASTVVCGGSKGVAGISIDGQPRWKSDRPLLAITGTRIAVASADEKEVVVLGAEDGKELWRAALPVGVERPTIVASCEEELYALSANKLLRVADVKGKQAITWQTLLAEPPKPQPTAPAIPTPVRPVVPVPTRPPAGLRRAPLPGTRPVAGQPPPVEPPLPSTIAIISVDCSADPILVATRDLPAPWVEGSAFARRVPTFPTGSLISVQRASGKIMSRVDGVHGFWPARDGSNRLEVSTEGGVTRWTRDLAEPFGLPLPALGALIDARGDRRLVRATPLTAALLDRDGVRAVIPLATSSLENRATADGDSASAALGAEAILAAVGVGKIAAATAPGSAAFRVAIPPKQTRVVRTSPPRFGGVVMPAELRDLPEAKPLAGKEIPKPDTGKHAVAAIALDSRERSTLYAAALEAKPTETTVSPVARIDLDDKQWIWQRSDGCGPGVPIGLAVAEDVVVCAASGLEATVRATSREGIAMWDHTMDHLDRVIAGGESVIAFDADRATVLDAPTGRVRAVLTSEDGGPMRAAIVAVARENPIDLVTFVIVAERGRIVARVPAIQMTAVWSLEVAGSVRAIERSNDGVLVTLDDGDAYRIALDGAVTPMPGLGLTWRVAAELVTGEAIGGPIPGVPLPPAPRPPPLPLKPGQLDKIAQEAPVLWNPIPAPVALGDSWQYTLYERSGAVRIRNDYGLLWPVVPALRGRVGAPLVVTAGGREVVVFDPGTGDPLRRVVLPAGGLPFGAIVDGSPAAGVVLASPLRVVLF